MVSSYLKYELSRSFGIVTSSKGNIVWSDNLFDPSARNTGLGCAITAANEEVLCWDIRKGEPTGRWRDSDCESQVTTIAQNKLDLNIFAVGYTDGSIRLWDAKISVAIVSFNSHHSAITALEFDKSGTRLASGSTDTDAIVWDLVAEVGLMRLKGHGDQITGVRFLEPEGVGTEDEDLGTAHATGFAGGFLVTASKDSLIKLWDLSSRQCVETHIAQTKGECWSLAFSPDATTCITAGNDGEMKLWSINQAGLLRNVNKTLVRPTTGCLQDQGVFNRRSKEKTFGIKFHPERKYFAVHGSEKAIEIFKVRTAEEMKKTLARKSKRRKDKFSSLAGGVVKRIEDLEQTLPEASALIASELFVSYVVVQTGGRVKSIDWAYDKTPNVLKLLVATTNNQIEMYNISTHEHHKRTADGNFPDYTRISSVEFPGHRIDVRALALSSDDMLLASVSNGALKIWNALTGSCVRTLETGYALCCVFLPGNKIVALGTRVGHIEIFDIASATMIERLEAHNGAIWALQVHPGGRCLASGSADKTLKFWNLEVVKEEIPGTQRMLSRLALAHTRTLTVTDDILGLCFSPDAKLIAVALLDSTVKVFFLDSLKLSLNLYGHKLPVLSLDISFDSKLIVTCSADKNIRIWGLDFGDCHKALLAHQDSVLQVAFIPSNQDGNGHHFVSCGKDRQIKYWDGDKFEQIQRLDGHHGEIWALTMSHTGQFFVTASHDKSIRIWRQTEKQIFVEEEREIDMDKIYESTLTTSIEIHLASEIHATSVEPVHKQTPTTLMAGERVVEALEVAYIDLRMAQELGSASATVSQEVPRQRHPVFMALGSIGAESYMMSMLQKIQPAALQDALLILTFAQVSMLFTFLDIFAMKSMDIPLTCRILFFMLNAHHRQIVTTKNFRKVLDSIEKQLQVVLQTKKDVIGNNLAALGVVGTRLSGAAKDFGVEERLEHDSRARMRKRIFQEIA